MSNTAYRNAHGVELKPGNWFLGADQYGQKQGIIDQVVRRGGIADINGGPSVVYKSAPGEYAVQTILADNVFQTLGPMTIEGDGTVKQNPKERYPFTIHWGSSASLARMSSVGLTLAKSIHEAQALMREGARHVEVTEWHNGLGETIWKNGDFISPRKNPLTRVKRNSPSQRGDGSKPAKGSRLYNRRKTTEAAPPGFYANPTPRLERADQPSQREHFNAKTGKMTKRASPRLKERRALTHYAATPGVWANPISYCVQTKNRGKWGIIAIFDTLSAAKEWGQTLADKMGMTVRVVQKTT